MIDTGICKSWEEEFEAAGISHRAVFACPAHGLRQPGGPKPK